jgi:hypothetical protein
MPDLAQFTITPLNAKNISVQRALISTLIVDSNTGETLVDMTGANAIQFPEVISSLTDSQRAELIEMVAHWLVITRSGLDF